VNVGFLRKLKDASGIAAPGQVARVNAQGRDLRRLLAEGAPGRAVIRGWRDTGERLVGNHVLDIDLHVVLATGAEYDLTHRMTIARDDTAPYAVGTEYAVRVDPDDRENLTFAAR